jgi:hypothetical protein
MKRGRGKHKGGSFERKVCKQLSLWVSRGKDEDLFWRSAISGGRATQSLKRGKKLRRQAGDICATSAEGCGLTDVFYVECKHYKDLNIIPFILRRRTGKLAGFWRVACREAKKHKKQPMLIACQNFFPPFVVVKPGNFGLLRPMLKLPGLCNFYLLDDLLATNFDTKEFAQ